MAFQVKDIVRVVKNPNKAHTGCEGEILEVVRPGVYSVSLRRTESEGYGINFYEEELELVFRASSKEVGPAKKDPRVAEFRGKPIALIIERQSTNNVSRDLRLMADLIDRGYIVAQMRDYDAENFHYGASQAFMVRLEPPKTTSPRITFTYADWLKDQSEDLPF